MELSTLERVMLLQVLPREGDITTLRLVRQLREALSFSEQEHQDYNIRNEGLRIAWNDAGEQAKKAVDLGPKALLVIADALKQRSKEKKLTPEYVDLYDRFVED